MPPPTKSSRVAGWLASTTWRPCRLINAGSSMPARRSSRHRRAGWLAGWLVGWVVGRLPGWAPTSRHRRAGSSILTGRARLLACWLAGSLCGCVAVWLCGWQAGTDEPASTSGLARACIQKTRSGQNGVEGHRPLMGVRVVLLTARASGRRVGLFRRLFWCSSPLPAYEPSATRRSRLSRPGSAKSDQRESDPPFKDGKRGVWWFGRRAC